VPFWIRNFKQDGDEIEFGKGTDPSIDFPDPRICNLHLAVARVFAASGFAEVVEKYKKGLDGDGYSVSIFRARWMRAIPMRSA